MSKGKTYVKGVSGRLGKNHPRLGPLGLFWHQPQDHATSGLFLLKNTGNQSRARAHARVINGEGVLAVSDREATSP